MPVGGEGTGWGAVGELVRGTCAARLGHVNSLDLDRGQPDTTTERFGAIRFWAAAEVRKRIWPPDHQSAAG